MRSPISPDHYRVIAAHVPGVTADEIAMNTAGNDHVVYFVRRQATFRFPRTPRRISPMRKRFLDAFEPLSPIPVPLITIHHDERTGSDYEVNTYLPGVPFEPALARAFSVEERRAIASELGAFLTAMHRFPLATARALGIDELDPATFGAYMEENSRAYPYFRLTVFPYLTAQQRQWVDRLFGDYIACVKARPFPVCVTHADMWTFHILIDPRGAKLTGVLDYWPRIADPAVDFKAFEYYGPEFVATVYQQYELLRDESFETRRLFYTGHDEVFEFARAIERGAPAQIAARQESLATYIAEHPASGGRDTR